MYELKTGDIMYIEESVRPWRMFIDPVLSSMKAVPKEVTERIDTLEEAYREEFFDYYRKKKSEDETLYTGEIQNAFQKEWEEKHPEFFDVDKLFESCSEDDLKNAFAALKEAREAFR